MKERDNTDINDSQVPGRTRLRAIQLLMEQLNTTNGEYIVQEASHSSTATSAGEMHRADNMMSQDSNWLSE